MATTTPDTSFDLADQISLISSEVLKFRIKNRPTLSDKDKSDLEDLEVQLDQSTAQLRAAGIAALSAVTKPAQQDIEAATKEAEALLRRIKRTERAVSIATSVLNLALAISAGQPQGIVSAIKDVKLSNKMVA